MDFSTTSFLLCTLCWWQSCCPTTWARTLMLTRWGALPVACCTYFTSCPADTCPGLVRGELESDLLKARPTSLAFEMLGHSLSALNLNLSRLNPQHANIPKEWGDEGCLSGWVHHGVKHSCHSFLTTMCQACLPRCLDSHGGVAGHPAWWRVGWKGRVKYGTKTKKACGRGFMGCPMPHLELSLGAGRRVQETSLKHHQGLQS